MVILPDGATFEMQWKQAIYTKGDNYVALEIVPMLTGKDIVIFPNCSNWKTEQNVFSEDERKEIMFLLERITWKRDLRILELDVRPYINEKPKIKQGMIELTQGYARLVKENLFDADNSLSKEQVKEIYCKLEKKFAESARGKVEIPKELLIKGSVIREYVMPIFENNKNIQIKLL